MDEHAHTQSLEKTQRVNGDLLTSREDLRKGGAAGGRADNGGRAEMINISQSIRGHGSIRATGNPEIKHIIHASPHPRNL